MSDKPAVYKSFLLRIWNNKAGSKRRVMVTRIDETGEQYYFANLDDLMMFLLQEILKVRNTRQTEAVKRLNWIHNLMKPQPGFVGAVVARHRLAVARQAHSLGEL